MKGFSGTLERFRVLLKGLEYFREVKSLLESFRVLLERFTIL